MTGGVFYSLMQRVGGDGRYQNISLIIWCVMYLNIGATSFYNPYLFSTGNFICSEQDLSNKDCNSYVCSLPQDQRVGFIDASFSSLATDNGYDSCSNSAELDKLQTFIYLGGFVGLFCSSFLNNLLSKRRIILITLTLNLIGLLATIFCTSIQMGTFGLFLVFSVKTIQSQIITCFITECSAESRRGRDIMVIYFFYGLGVTLNGAVFYLFSSWKLALFIYQVLPFVFCYLGVLLYIKQTPYDLVVHSTPQTILLDLTDIAQINEIQNCTITIEQITLMKYQYEQNQKSKHDYIVTIIDLIRYKSLRFKFINLILLSIFVAIGFFMPELVLRNYDFSIYLNGIILGSSQVLASIFCYIYVNDCKRKHTLYLISIIGFVSSFPVFLLANNNSGIQSSLASATCQTVGLFIFRLCITVGYNFYCMIEAEIYPTQIRSVALQINCLTINLALVITPIAEAWFEAANTSIIILFSFTCLMVIILTYPLPETHGVLPPEMIEELKYKQQLIEGERQGQKI